MPIFQKNRASGDQKIVTVTINDIQDSGAHRAYCVRVKLLVNWKAKQGFHKARAPFKSKKFLNPDFLNSNHGLVFAFTRSMMKPFHFNFYFISRFFIPLFFSAFINSGVTNAGQDPSSVVKETLFLGDVEGRMELVESFVERIRNEMGEGIVSFSEGRKRLVIAEGYRMVVLGDVTDQGLESMELLDLFNETQQAQPKQFRMISGNRDGNKVRLNRELNPEALRQPFPEEPGKMSFRDWLVEYTKKNGLEFSEDLLSNREMRCRYIMQVHMGMPMGFENRRINLARFTGRSHISDMEVVDSFLNDQLEDFETPENSGREAKYLRHSHTLIREGTALVVHSALIDENLDLLEKHVNWDHFDEKTPEQKLMVLDTAIEALDIEYQNMVDRALNLSLASGEKDLLQWFSPIEGMKNNPFGLGYSNFIYSEDGNHITFEHTQKVQEFFKKFGLDTLIFGHKPLGDTPHILISAEGKFRLFGLDVTYKKPIEGKLLAPLARLIHGDRSRMLITTPMPNNEIVIANHRVGEPSILGRIVNGMQIYGWNLSEGPFGSRMEGFQVRQSWIKNTKFPKKPVIKK